MAGNQNRAIAEQPLDNPLRHKQSTVKNFLLVIAIDHYDDPRLNLGNPVLDANKLLHVLCKRYDFKPENPDDFEDLRHKDTYTDSRKYNFPIKVYKDKYIHCLYNEQVSNGNITARINEIKKHITKEDNLLIYFAGHGYANIDTNDWYFTHYKYNIQDGNGIPFNEIARNAYLQAGEVCCKNLLLILDSCFSGSVLNGFLAQKNPQYGQMALTSTGGTELAADGKIMKGSPFSAALIKVLIRNKSKRICVRDLFTELKKLFDEPNQTLQLGFIPGSDGLSCFEFTLNDPDGQDVHSFAESIFNDLNFYEERGIIVSAVDSSLNTNYIVLSSVSSEDRFHILTGNVCSRMLLTKIGLLEPPRQIVNVRCKDADIWKSIARRLNVSLPDADPEDAVLDGLNDQLMFDYMSRDKDPTAESVAPYLLSLMFENLTPAQALNVKTFCEKLLIGLQQKRQSVTVQYSPLLLFIFDLRSGKNLFAEGNLVLSPTACDKASSPFILFHTKEESKSTIRRGQAETWFYAYEKMGNSKLRAEWIKQHFGQDQDVNMIEFILAAAAASGLQVPKVAEILFKSN